MKLGASAHALEATALFPSRSGFLTPKTDIWGEKVKNEHRPVLLKGEFPWEDNKLPDGDVWVLPVSLGATRGTLMSHLNFLLLRYRRWHFLDLFSWPLLFINCRASKRVLCQIQTWFGRVKFFCNRCWHNSFKSYPILNFWQQRLFAVHRDAGNILLPQCCQQQKHWWAMIIFLWHTLHTLLLLMPPGMVTQMRRVRKVPVRKLPLPNLTIKITVSWHANSVKLRAQESI